MWYVHTETVSRGGRRRSARHSLHLPWVVVHAFVINILKLISLIHMYHIINKFIFLLPDRLQCENYCARARARTHAHTEDSPWIITGKLSFWELTYPLETEPNCSTERVESNCCWRLHKTTLPYGGSHRHVHSPPMRQEVTNNMGKIN
jgi:hypothetical protein